MLVCATRGWIAVMSLRLIPVVPFSVINYAVGASAVRLLPYTLATLVGVLPGTAAVVILGDALTGDVSPLLLMVSLCTGFLGLGLLVYEIRHHRRHKSDPGDRNRRCRRAGASRVAGLPPRCMLSARPAISAYTRAMRPRPAARGLLVTVVKGWEGNRNGR